MSKVEILEEFLKPIEQSIFNLFIFIQLLFFKWKKYEVINTFWFLLKNTRRSYFLLWILYEEVENRKENSLKINAKDIALINNKHNFLLKKIASVKLVNNVLDIFLTSH